MQKLIKRQLKRLAQKVVAKYQPTIVGITGSYGKTSTREAIKFALGSARKVRASNRNHNNEYGLPLTILGEDTPGKSLFGWLGVLWRGWRLSIGMSDDYPEILVLEYGADRKGDIQYLTSIARPHIAVITGVGVIHAEFFGTIDDVQEEKGTLVRSVGESGIVVLNADDERVRSMRHMAQGAVVTYGLQQDADIHVSDIRLELRHDGDIEPGEVVAQMEMDLRGGHDEATTTLTNIVGDAHARSVLAGAAAALQLGVSLGEIAKNLEDYYPAPGRMRLLPGIKHSLLLDDSYNAAPAAMHAALDVLGNMPVGGEAKRIAVLGDMRELGRYTEQMHLEMGQHVARLPIELLVTIGESSRDIARGALENGMDQARVFTYANSVEAGRFVQERMKRGDVVLIKGSQGSRTEKVTKEILANPLAAPDVLVRQSEKWLKS